MYEVKLTYFSLDGNKKSEGILKTKHKDMFEIVGEIDILRCGLPGVGKSWGSFILVQPSHLNHSFLMIPNNDLLKLESELEASRKK